MYATRQWAQYAHRGQQIHETANVRINVNIEVCSRDHDCRGKAMTVTYSECALVI
jgi:hypothetical protein